MNKMFRIVWSLLCGFGLLLDVDPSVTKAAATSGADTKLIERGAYLAKAADCGACHTVPHGKSFAGGLPIASPVGVIYSSNITPSPNFGIGHHTLAQFARALREGVRGDGANLYPAMPYTSYSLLTDEDVRALYAFFMNSVVAVDQPAPLTHLAFPLDIRASMKVWNLIFLNKAHYEVAPAHDAEWNRGRYLVQALAHCGECHTPRGSLMQTKNGLELAGAQVGPWYAPNVTSDVASGVGSWTIEELAQYLKTGSLIGKARAAGSMAEAVEDSFQYLTDADIRAIATYVLAVPPINEGVEGASRFSFGKPYSELGSLRGVSGIRAERESPSGQELFQEVCASCHEALGQGTKDGYFPSLFDNSAVGARNTNNMIATILNGVNRTTLGGQAYMPGFGGGGHDLGALTDEQIALIGNYVMIHFGRPDTKLNAKGVAEVRRGGPRSLLPAMARAGVVLAAVGAILLVGLLYLSRRRRVLSRRYR